MKCTPPGPYLGFGDGKECGSEGKGLRRSGILRKGKVR